MANKGTIQFQPMNKTNITENQKFNASMLKDENTIGIKLAEARKQVGLSQVEVSKALNGYGLSFPSQAISKWEMGYTMPNALTLLALCDLYQIDNPVNYFTGAVPESLEFSPLLSQKGLNMLQSFKELLIASGQFKPVTRRTTKFAEQARVIEMKVSRMPASAGVGNFLDDEQFELVQFAESSIPAGAEFGIRISGDSMLPNYTDEQIVWVEQCDELNPGEVGIFVYDGAGYIKQYQEVMPKADELEDYTINGVVYPKIYLVSFNEKYPPRLVNPELGFQIVGRVLN